MARGICTVEDCGRREVARGWCITHYSRWQRHGHIEDTTTPFGAPLAFIEKAKAFDGEECLIWPYAIDGHGYPKISTGGKTRIVHRMICEAAHGLAPESKTDAAHNCGTPQCVNPAHLRWATRTENMLDCRRHGRYPGPKAK